MDDLMNLLFGIVYNNHDADLVERIVAPAAECL